MRTSAAEPGCTSAPWMSTTPGSSVGARPRMESPRSNRLVEQVMTRPPYNDAIHAPIHASWLNQVEIYFSIVQRKVLTPNDFSDLDAVADRLLDFQYYWEATARPFEWTFTRDDLKNLLDKFEQQGTLR